MEVQELRIGNIVMETIYDFPKKEIVFGCENFSQPDDYYTPIPLTEEWLLKLGFEKENNGWGKKFNGTEFSIYVYNGEAYCFNNPDYNTTLDFVHQLQNLYFALIGTELKPTL